MVTWFRSWVGTHWLATGISLLFFVLAGMVLLQAHRYQRLLAEKELCLARSEGLAISNASLLASLQKQNKAIRALEMSSSKKKTALNNALIEAQKHRSQSERKARLISTYDTLARSECEQLKELLSKYGLARQNP